MASSLLQYWEEDGTGGLRSGVELAFDCEVNDKECANLHFSAREQ